MSITYNTGIPAAANAPSADQPNMLTNTNAVNSWTGIDHVGFNVGGGATSGQHLQVTFNSNNEPSSPTTPPVLFTNTKDGAGNTLPGSLAQLFFYTGDNTKSKNQYVSQSSGSTLLPGGIILKWGTISFLSATQPVTFAGGGFPNNVFAISFGVLSSTPSTNGVITAQPLSKTTFTANQQTGNPLTAYYIAIGN